MRSKKTKEKELLKAVDTSDTLHAEIYSATKEDDSTKQPETVAGHEPIKEVDAIKQEEVVEKVVEKVEKPVQEPTTQPKPVEKPEPKIIDKQDVVDFKPQYDVLAGKYNAEIPRYKSQVKAKDDEIQKLKDTIVSLGQKELSKPQEQPVAVTEMPIVKSADTKVPSFDIETKKYLKPEDSTDYGDGMLDLVVRGANEVVELKLKDYNDKLIEYINNRIRQIEQKIPSLDDVRKDITAVKTVQHDSTADKFYSDLNALSPNWIEIKDNAHSNGFSEWLDKPSPEAGFIRKDLLADAFNYFDANRVAMLYNAYTQNLESGTIESDEIVNEPTITSLSDTQVSVAQPIVESTVISSNIPSVNDLIQPSKTKAREEEVFTEEIPPNIGDATVRIAKAGEDLRMKRITVDQYNDVVENTIGEGTFYKNNRLVR